VVVVPAKTATKTVKQKRFQNPGLPSIKYKYVSEARITAIKPVTIVEYVVVLFYQLNQ
jgi:hypothetical protein